jgi:hypothetical protein
MAPDLKLSGMSAKEEKAKGKAPIRETERRNRLGALAGEVPALTKLALGKRGFAEADIVGQWARIVGPELARLALPVKLRMPRAKAEPMAGAIAANVAGGTLTLRTSAAASTEVQHLKPRILERIATYFGYPAVTEIRIEIGDRRRPVPARRNTAPAAPPDLGRVTDPELRAALQRLGAARARRG